MSYLNVTIEEQSFIDKKKAYFH